MAALGLPSNGRLTGCGASIADVPEAQTAFSQRDAVFEFTTAAEWTEPAEDEARITGARHYAATLAPFASGVYVNALADEGTAGVRRAYRPDTLARLAALKRRYDPDGVFTLNHSMAAGATVPAGRLAPGRRRVQRQPIETGRT